jgi:hypothetical protein
MADRDKTLEALLDAVEHLAQQVRVLTAAVDDLTTEVQWRNRNLPASDIPQPFMLRSMPADPCADDWALNRVPPERVAELRDEVARQAPSGRLFE